MEPDEYDEEEEDFWNSDLFDNSWYEDPEESYQDWLEDVWWDD